MDTHVKTNCFADVMLAHTPVGIAIFDARDLRLLEGNALFMQVLEEIGAPSTRGWAQADCSSEHWMPEAREAGLLDIFRNVARTGIPYRGQEFAFQSSKRGLSYWNWSLDPVRDQDGNIAYLVQTISEVTDQVLARQQAEQARSALSIENSIVETERRRLEVIETVARSVRESLDAEHIARVALDAIFAQFNAISICLHTALPEQRALRSLCSRTIPVAEEALKATHYIPYERLSATRAATVAHDPIVIEDFQVVVAQGRIPKDSPSLNALMQCGTRGYVCVPLWFWDRFEGTLCASFDYTIRADGPEVSALVGAGTHIASALAHARLHATIESERKRLKDILDRLPDGILIAEAASGTISYANPAAASLLGIPLTDLIAGPLNRPHWLKINQETAPAAHSTPPWNFMVIRALSGETPRSKETIVARPDGSMVVTLTSSAPLYAENGLLTGAVIVFQDLTEQKRFEQQKNDFFSIANHELRTPITIIQGFAEILAITTARSQQQSEDTLTSYALTNILEQSQHLIRLIEQMLDISRIEHIQFKLQRKPLDLLQMVRHVMESQAITTKRHQFRLTLEGIEPDASVIASVDEGRMQQVLHNLMSNAIKYSSGGEIEVGMRRCPHKAGEVLIWVKDQGIGIPAHELPLIFKRFHRAADIDRSVSGFGIGLYLVREIVTCHGGRVWAESIEGEGSTFYVSLPLS
ncbi:MAG TPA: ATP-binding protein [Ktedonobacteraceae bacterium]|nr:ATP-binding protein [Ktedonobacteraceae bacterium]